LHDLGEFDADRLSNESVTPVCGDFSTHRSIDSSQYNEPSKAEQIRESLVCLLMESDGLSKQDATRLVDHYRSHLAQTFNGPGRPDPAWQGVPLTVRRLAVIELGLEAEWSSNVTLSDLIGHARRLDDAPAPSDLGSRLYASMLARRVDELAADEEVVSAMLSSPLDGLRSLMPRGMEQALNLFLRTFDDADLPAPNALDCAALLHGRMYATGANNTQGTDTITDARAAFKRALALDELAKWAAPKVLDTLDFDGTTLAGANGSDIDALARHPGLEHIPAIFTLNHADRVHVVRYALGQVGMDQDGKLGTVQHSAATVLARFPNSTTLLYAGYPDGPEALLTQLIALHLTASRGAKKIDEAWRDAFWSDAYLATHLQDPDVRDWFEGMLGYCPTVPSDRQCSLDRTLIVVRALEQLAASDDNEEGKLRTFARGMLARHVGAGVYGGDSWRSRAQSLIDYLKDDGRADWSDGSPPQSAEQWSAWLKERQQGAADSAAHPNRRGSSSPAPAQVSRSLDYAHEIIGWPQSANTTASDERRQFATSANAVVPSADIELPDELHPLAWLARSGYKNVIWRGPGNGSQPPFDVKLISGSGGRVTTVRRWGPTLIDDEWTGNRTFAFGQPLIEASDGRIFAGWDKELELDDARFAGYRLSELETPSYVKQFFNTVDDFSNHGAARLFDEHFVVTAEPGATTFDHRAFFERVYDGSWFFRGFFNSKANDLGRWQIKVDQKFGEINAYVRLGEKVIELMADSQMEHLPPLQDLAGESHPFLPEQIVLHEWMHMLTGRLDPPHAEQVLGGLAVDMTAFVLEQIGLHSMRTAYQVKPRPLKNRLLVHQVSDLMHQCWERGLMMNAPSRAAAVFGPDTAVHPVIAPVVQCVLSLPPRRPAGVPHALARGFRVRNGEKSESLLNSASVNDFLRSAYRQSDLFGRIVWQKQGYLNGAPWAFVVDSSKVGPSGSSHWIDVDSRTVYLADPGDSQAPVRYLGPNGLQRLGWRRQVMTAMLQILLNESRSVDDAATEGRQPSHVLTNACFAQMGEPSAPYISGATVGSDQLSVTRLLGKLSRLRKVALDEDVTMRRAIRTSRSARKR
jgi:hypothetical protein